MVCHLKDFRMSLIGFSKLFYFVCFRNQHEFWKKMYENRGHILWVSLILKILTISNLPIFKPLLLMCIGPVYVLCHYEIFEKETELSECYSFIWDIFYWDVSECVKTARTMPFEMILLCKTLAEMLFILTSSDKSGLRSS